jgi:hypothetical protein
MTRFNRLLPAAVLSAAAALALPSVAPAQFRYGANPAAGYDYAQTQAVANVASARAAAFAYSPYGNNFYQTPLNGFLTGAADVIGATGQYEIQHQQANLGRQAVKSAHIDNRRKMFDELNYEKANTPPESVVAEQKRREQLAYYVNSAQPTEIWSGTALNAILGDVNKIETQTGLRGALVPLDPDILKHLSLTTRTTAGSAGLLRDGGHLKWPVELRDARFDAERKEVDRLLPQLVSQAAGGEVDPGDLKQLNASLNRMSTEVDAAIDDMTPDDNIRAKRYVKDVISSARLLRDPNVAKELPGGAWTAKGNTVGELMEHMRKNGLTFAAAAPADQPYYTALHADMVQYDASLNRLAYSQTALAGASGPPR